MNWTIIFWVFITIQSILLLFIVYFIDKIISLPKYFPFFKTKITKSLVKNRESNDSIQKDRNVYRFTWLYTTLWFGAFSPAHLLPKWGENAGIFVMLFSLCVYLFALFIYRKKTNTAQTE